MFSLRLQNIYDKVFSVCVLVCNTAFFQSPFVLLIVGPWFAGYLLTDHIGVVFAWGIIVNSTFIPGGHTYIYAMFQVCLESLIQEMSLWSYIFFISHFFFLNCKIMCLWQFLSKFNFLLCLTFLSLCYSAIDTT